MRHWQHLLTIAEMCATVEGTEPYCTDPIFYKHIFEYTMTILKFGHRIVDIDYEMNRRWVMRDKLSVAVDECNKACSIFTSWCTCRCTGQ